MTKNLTCCFILISFAFYAQVQQEINPPEYIRTVIFKGESDDQFPVVQLGDPIHLEFDDLTAEESDYYYKIIHCNYDWTVSDVLRSQYLNGLDDQRIASYKNSFNTLQSYSNYQLNFPNRNTAVKISGNYMLEIYDDNEELLFSRRFVIYKNIASVGVSIKRTRNFKFIDSKQVVNIKINTNNLQIPNPKKDIKVAILKNNNWSSVKTNIAPQYTLGTTLIYKYDTETSFFAGNEYLNFDTKDIRAPGGQVAYTTLEDIYQHFLYTNKERATAPYTYFPDINGDFSIRTLQGTNYSIEAEYSTIHFGLKYNPKFELKDIYVYGKFNNYDFNDENKLYYNENTENLETSFKIKQGFYNYKYVIRNKDGTIDTSNIGGNFHNTENNYLVLVYFRNFGDLYDSIIGVGSGNSATITN